MEKRWKTGGKNGKISGKIGNGNHHVIIEK